MLQCLKVCSAINQEESNLLSNLRWINPPDAEEMITMAAHASRIADIGRVKNTEGFP